MIRKVLFVFLFIIIAFLAYHYKSVIYGIGQAAGQIEVLYNSKSIEKLLQKGELPDSTIKKFQYIQKVKSFAQDSLGLNPSKNYTTFYDQKGEAILWMVTASPEFEIEAYQWKFPIAGKFSYKGFFNHEKTKKEAERLSKKGFDVKISEVSAWSTLGFFRDPILSSMLNKADGSLADLIIHELSHATVYKKNQITFNENFATFVGKEGAKRFLKYNFGEHSKELETYHKNQTQSTFIRSFMQDATAQLDSLYSTFNSTMSLAEKRQAKAAQIALIKDKLAHSNYYSNPEVGKKSLANFTINNATLSAYKTYHEKQNTFEDRLKNEFNNDLKAFITAIKKE